MLHTKANKTKCSIVRFFFLRYLYKFNHLPQSTRLGKKNQMLNSEPIVGHLLLLRKCNNADFHMQHTDG